ncbi:hypothetical protein AAFF_G00314780 [Aldrovandia affinis]|uniref:Uncharacterized protein n=1 Tax=Aldrovandia affinis TaxID=143900 RepID=A0AAD7R7N5_9TELE|nr:hypothetical protein AAFF_G00314780 [Aldrovandia affinis]
MILNWYCHKTSMAWLCADTAAHTQPGGRLPIGEVPDAVEPRKCRFRSSRKQPQK